jgi:primosomal protein N' (replication factor Y)
VTDGVDMGVLPGMGDLPESAAPAPAGEGAGDRGGSGRGGGAAKRNSAAKKNATARKNTRRPAGTLPVARVAVDVPLPHLDRPFDYLVPSALDDAAVPGCRVRVRFAGQLMDGFLLERADRSDHEGRLAYLERVTSPEPVLAPEIAALAREIADRYAGTLADVLRLAIPPRHARVESEDAPAPGRGPADEAAPAGPVDEAPPVGPVGEAAPVGEVVPAGPDEATADPAGPAATDGTTGAGAAAGDGEASPSRGDVPRAPDAPGVTPPAAGPWEAYPAGASFLEALTAGRAPRAVWSALPGGDWATEVALAVRATLAGGRGALVIVADGRDVARVDRALRRELGSGRHVALTAELGPAERYRRWLAVRRGRAAAVVGTRAAMFAPVRDLGLVVLWDDGDDVHAEPHAPYPHAREVLALRAHRAGAGALIGGFTRTTDATQLVRAGWARPLGPERERLRASMPYIRPAGDDADLARDEAARSARLPHLAFRAARQGLEHGPVLVQVPRRGYVPALACSRCRGPARCPECEGPLSLGSSHAAPYCRWCGRIAGDWRCPGCGGRQVRAVVVGARRTAEELGRAFPGVPVRTSGRDGVLAEVSGEPALVVATPGAEPVAEGGYAAALLLDGWVLLGRADLRAGEEALRRWMNAAALVRPRGPVIVLADGSLTPVQALIRWDAVTYAERELDERRALGFPPAVRMASLTGTPQSVRELVEAAGLPDDAEVLGPVELGEGRERALVRVDRRRGAALSRLLKTAQAARSTRKAADVVRVRVDPLELI